MVPEIEPLAATVKTQEERNVPLKAIGNYTLQQSLGKGSMGKVKLGVHNVTGEKIAVKIVPRANLQMFNSASYIQGKTEQQINKERAREENREVRTIREAHMMMLFKHPNIVGLKDLVIQGPYFYILMDYVGGGQLLHYIVKRQRLSDRRTRLFSRQIVSALDYLHRNSIVHRDLKIENIMVDKSGRHIKIIDFGLSNLFCPERLLTTYCGSLYFAAPELLKANPYSGPEVDIWSLGVVIYVMATGSVPFDDKSMPGLHEKIKKGHVDYPSHLSLDCQDLLSRIFHTDPLQRIVMTDIIHHPWINQDAAPIKNYLPPRKLLKMPLDPKIIDRIAQGFDLGSSQEIEQKLTLIVHSPIYRKALEGIAQAKAMHESSIVYDGPQSLPAAYHPYLALYQLATEKQAAQEHATAAMRTLSIKRSLSSKGSIESMGGTSSARSSQASLVDESGPRLLTQVPMNQTPVAGTSTAIISTNYLTRIQRWLRSSVSQHQLPIEHTIPTVTEAYAPSVVVEEEEEDTQDFTAYYTDNEEETIHTVSAGSGTSESKSLFRKLSKAILRKESSKSLDTKKSQEASPPPVPPKDIHYTRGQVPPGMSVATVTSRQTAHTVDLTTAVAQTKQPSPHISRSASLASPRRGRKGSVNRLTDKIGSWLSRSASVKHNA
ncbi:kinase-like domain-containing protein [Sporodiniella umbellata]|nr:kinase-like domain-containing protein [Sporodiniella umbellata]